MNGRYEHLDGGNLSDALQDFTGGTCEIIDLEKPTGQSTKQTEQHESIFEAMKKAYDRKSFMACAINVK